MDTDNIQIPAGISKFGRIWIVSSLIRRIRIFIGGEAIRMSGFTTKYFYKRIKFSVIVTTPLSSQQRPSSFSTINSVPAARRPIYNQHCRSFFFAISALLADNFVAMSVRPREGDLNVRAGFTFESERSTYKLEELIGDGGYGQVFEADAISKGKKQDTKRLAVKLERRSGATDIEARVLETAKDKNCRHIPKIFDHVSYIVFLILINLSDCNLGGHSE